MARHSTHNPNVDNLSASMDVTSISAIQQSLSASQAAEKKADAAANIKASIDHSMLELRDLTAQYSAADDWETADDHEVETAMSDIKEWERKLKEIKKERITIKSSISRHGITDLHDDIESLDTRIGLTEAELRNATKAIKDADVSKGLYTNRKTRSTPLKLPTFSGRPGEDYLDFQEKFQKAAISNKIPKSEQLDKLREGLYGKATNLIPPRLTDLKEAWSILKASFGDPMQLLQHRISAMQKLGHLPSNIHKNPARGVDWCLEIELGIADLIRLGERDERLKMAAYCDFTINGIAQLLQEHLTIADKIDGMACYGRDKLEKIAKLVKDKRTTLQAKVVKNNIDIQGQGARSSNLNALQGSDDDSQDEIKSKPAPVPASQTKIFTIYPHNIVHFGAPRRLPDCRICRQLETQGDNRNLYDDHYGNYPTHCPRWAEMTMSERLTILQQAGYCDHCLDPKKKFRNVREVLEHKRDECAVSRKKNRYSCTVPNCSLHSWCCKPHRHKNDELLRAFNEEAAKRNHVFSFTLTHAMTASGGSSSYHPPLPSGQATNNLR